MPRDNQGEIARSRHGVGPDRQASLEAGHRNECHDRNDRNFRAAESSDGFIARSGYDGEPGPESCGKQVFPRFYVERGDGWSPSTLSLWRDLELPMAFTYAGIHAEAMRYGREWF